MHVQDQKYHWLTTPMPLQMTAWVYQLLHSAEAKYLPEKAHEGYCTEGEFLAHIASDEARAELRGHAIDYFCVELDVMLENFQGRRERCLHGASRRCAVIVQNGADRRAHALPQLGEGQRTDAA